MKRRTALALAAASLAGCVGTGGGSPAPETTETTPTPTPTSTPSSPTITDVSFARTGECSPAGDVAVDMDAPFVHVTGCIQGKNGCMYPSLEEATYDADSDTLRVVVTTVKEGGEDAVCTQMLVSRGYALDVEFAGGLPGSVDVRHDGA